MRKNILSAVVTVIMLCSASAAPAEDAKASVKLEDIKKALGLGIYLQGGYTYNFENPKSKENDFRIFDHEANTFNVDLAQIIFAKDAPAGGIGFKVKLSAGETAKWIHSRGLGSTDDSFDLTEAYIDYMAPVGRGLKLRFGKFVTMHGAEVIEAKDNANYSRSFLFNYAIPFTHTGFMASYPFTDQFTASLYLVNGWDNTDDNNKGKTVCLSLAATPVEQFSSTLNVMYGPEQDDNNSDNRLLADLVATIKPMKNLSFVLNVDYAKEEVSHGDDVKWYGYAGIVKYDFSDKYSLALRGEYFKDEDGVRTGVKQALKEVTLTPEIKLADGLILRPEYRHDWSDKKSFLSGKEKSQDTIALAMMYSW